MDEAWDQRQQAAQVHEAFYTHVLKENPVAPSLKSPTQLYLLPSLFNRETL